MKALAVIYNSYLVSIDCRYEALKVDRVGEMEKVLQFLGFNYDYEILANSLNKDYTTFKRYM